MVMNVFDIMAELKNINLTFGVINCNSMNVSMLGNRNAKTYLKIEGVTGKRADVILISDIRAKNKGDELKRMFGLTRNGSYKLYLNSSKESRGVGVAIKRNIYHDIRRTYNGTGDENVLLLDVLIKNVRLTIGTVYGPNNNDVDFYNGIRRQIVNWGNKCIIGGDFNTILSTERGIRNLDREGGDRVPNRQNSNVLNDWIRENILLDPFRALYPETKEYSYIPFRNRGRDGRVDIVYGKTRLDFFLISPDVLGSVKSVTYEDRLGADLDHKEVRMGVGQRKNSSKVSIRDSTLDDVMTMDNGVVAVYEAIANHLTIRDNELLNGIVQLDILLGEKVTILRLYERRVLGENFEDRIAQINDNIELVKSRLPDIDELLDRGIDCNYRVLYEVIGMEIKNRLLKIQKRIRDDKRGYRSWLVEKEDYMSRVFGENSLQRLEVKDEILRCDDAELKENATRFKDFLDMNNERATSVFCRLSKEGGLCDDLSQIRDGVGNKFSSKEKQDEHIRGYYSELYKKKMDNLLGIEEFLAGGEGQNRGVATRRLTVGERDSLEGEVTLDELRKALDSSNFGSTSGWDGISFKVIRKFWDVLSKPMLKMINETFNEGELMETYKLGLIKLIPKKGEAAKVGYWRPITLLCCGYKVISGIVAKRLEKYLDKLIGRAQKGFMKNKSIHTCTLNIMNSIDRAWNLGREVGVMCVDFSKAFDSVEHEMIKNVMGFFGFGNRMTKMVMTLLKGRTSRVILDDGYSKTIHIARGTPQGDRSSPYIFILCIEVLLIKLRLESNGMVKDSELFLEWQEMDARRLEPLTGEAYADDLTVIFNMSRECVHNILKILESFLMVSGLSVNTDKTQLMVVGSDNWAEGDRI